MNKEPYVMQSFVIKCYSAKCKGLCLLYFSFLAAKDDDTHTSD